MRAPVVVKEGVWSGHPWELIAYPSTTDGLCLAVAPKGAQARGDGAAMSCAPQIGVARTPDGAVTVWCSDHDPFDRMKGMHGIRLRPDSTVIELKVRLFKIEA